MADKLSWNPPKWKSYSFDGTNFKVELETGEVFEGRKENAYIALEEHKAAHKEVCFKIFGILLGASSEHSTELSELSKVLDLKLIAGNWPEYYNVEEFLKRYYERVAKIGNLNISKIYIETEFDVTPKFTI